MHRLFILALMVSATHIGCVEKTVIPDDDTTGADDDVSEEPVLGVPESLPDAPLYEEYFTRLLPVGYATPPLQWELVAGVLPDGIAMDSDGVIQGIATEEGAYDLGVHVVDASGTEGEGTVSLTVAVDPASLYLGVWFDEVDPMCTDLQLLCLPWVRVQGAGEPQTERELLPARFHVGPDGNVDDAFDDDILYEMLDADEVTWSWTPLEWPTGDETTLFPEDGEIQAGGRMVGGELTGAGIIAYEHPKHGTGTATGYVVAPDWCPGWGC